MDRCRGPLVALAVFALLSSACLGAPPSLDPDDEPWPEPSHEVVLEEKRFESTAAAPQLDLAPFRVTPEWSFELPPRTLGLSLTLSWSAPLNGYAFVLEGAGMQERYELESDPLERPYLFTKHLPDPEAGAYKAYVEADQVILDDTFELAAQWEKLVPEAPNGTISFEREGDAWRASVAYRTTGEVDDSLRVEADTFNGAVRVSFTQDDEATARVVKWARADTQERAEELLAGILLTLAIDTSRLKAVAERDESVPKDEQEALGAFLDVKVPVNVQGSARTANGAIDLEDLVASNFRAETKNGRITANLQTSGSLTLDTKNGAIDAVIEGRGSIDLVTSNGKIDLDLEPTGSTDLGAESSNGKLDLRLKETDAIGYTLDARTSNGKISETMDEASLDGTDEEATLRSEDYRNRAIQVTGTAHTTNGAIEFIGT